MKVLIICTISLPVEGIVFQKVLTRFDINLVLNHFAFFCIPLLSRNNKKQIFVVVVVTLSSHRVAENSLSFNRI